MSEDRKVPALSNPRPRTGANRKLLGLLFGFFITVVIILFFQSSLSRISAIEIEGNELLSSNEIGQAAQLAAGDLFFTVDSSTVARRITALPIVKSVEVTKHFPGVIRIAVQEFPKVAFQMTSDGKMAAILADGATIALSSSYVPLDMPILSGWSDSDPNKAELCRVLGGISAGSLADISEIKPDPSESYPDKIKLYTRSQFEIYTTITYLADKIDSLPAYISILQESHITNGVIRMLEVDNHSPFAAGDGGKGGALNPNQNVGAGQGSSSSPNKDLDKSGNKQSPKPTIKSSPKPTVTPTPKETSRPS